MPWSTITQPRRSDSATVIFTVTGRSQAVSARFGGGNCNQTLHIFLELDFFASGRGSFNWRSCRFNTTSEAHICYCNNGLPRMFLGPITDVGDSSVTVDLAGPVRRLASGHNKSYGIEGRSTTNIIQIMLDKPAQFIHRSVPLTRDMIVYSYRNAHNLTLLVTSIPLSWCAHRWSGRLCSG